MNPASPNFSPEYYGTAVLRVVQDGGTSEWKYLGVVIQPDGIYLREWTDDTVTELGHIEVAVTALLPAAVLDDWHRVQVDLSGDGVSVTHTLAGEDPETIIAETTVLVDGQIGFGVGAAADFRFDDVSAKGAPSGTSVSMRYHYDPMGRVVGRTLDPGGANTSEYYYYEGDHIVQKDPMLLEPLLSKQLSKILEK